MGSMRAARRAGARLPANHEQRQTRRAQMYPLTRERNVFSGSALAARSAGGKVAAIAAATIRATGAARLQKSVVFTPKSLLVKRWNHRERGRIRVDVERRARGCGKRRYRSWDDPPRWSDCSEWPPQLRRSGGEPEKHFRQPIGSRAARSNRITWSRLKPRSTEINLRKESRSNPERNRTPTLKPICAAVQRS
jgi:hypothetical protein